MADKITLDFENNIITWDTDVQKGTEYCPDLAERKPAIIKAMGYSNVNFTPVVRIFEALVNGQIGKEEAEEKLAEFVGKGGAEECLEGNTK